jgi:hypothetical protein
MRKVLIVLAIVTLLMTQRHAADAGKGASSFRGGSGASSSSHSSSSAGRSYSSGGKSYSSSGSSSFSSPGGKGYSSGGSSSTPSAGKTVTSGSFSAPSGKSYSSGGKSTSSVAGASSSAPKSNYSSPGGKSYSAGSSSTGTSRPSTGTSGATPRAPVAYDSLPAAEQKKVESRQAYVAAQQPRKTYIPSTGAPRPIDPKDRQIVELRNQLDHERWVNRLPRAQVFYGSYYTRPLVYYNDPYNSFFWWWLLDRSLNDRAYWAYHHRYDMDDARYQALLARDAALQAQIAQLELQNVQRDRAYVPPDLTANPDLMYSDDYVNAVYNPQPAPTAYPPVPYHPTSYSDSGPSGGSVFGQVLFTLFLILLVGAFIGLVVWLVFCKRWNI